MNIVLYTNSFLPSVGGKEIVVHYLAREFHRMGHRVRVLTHGGCLSDRKLKFDYRVHRWPTLRGAMPEKLLKWQLWMDLKMFGADVVHAHNTYPCAYFVSKLNAVKSVPLVVTPHGTDIRRIPEINFGMLLDPQKAAKVKEALDKAQILTAISESIRKSIAEAGAAEDKIIDIPNGIDLDRFQCGMNLNPMERIGIGNSYRMILSVGNYRRIKGQELLIQAMPLILNRHPDARLVIAGRNQEPLEKAVSALKLEDKVILTGPIPFQDFGRKSSNDADGSADPLAALYRACDVYVSASLDEGAEGLSLALLDAMGAGKAVVATDISGNRDMILHERTGLLVPPGEPAAIAEAVSAVLGHRVLQEKLGENARMAAEGYSWENIAKQYLNVYRCAMRISNP